MNQESLGKLLSISQLYVLTCKHMEKRINQALNCDFDALLIECRKFTPGNYNTFSIISFH